MHFSGESRPGRRMEVDPEKEPPVNHNQHFTKAQEAFDIFLNLPTNNTPCHTQDISPCLAQAKRSQKDTRSPFIERFRKFVAFSFLVYYYLMTMQILGDLVWEAD